jgi:Ca2+-binding RTX toxin-like protein
MRKRTLYPLLIASVMGMSGLISASSASAASNCVVGPGVMQDATTVTGSGGNDTIDCTSADPGKTINGNGGNDTITGTSFDDSLNGGDGDDTITGGVGNDVLTGGNGMDTLTGSAGNDRLSGPDTDSAVDKLNGGDGTDTCGPVGAPPDTRTSCES